MHCVPCSCKPGAHPRRQPPPPPSPPHSSSPSCPPAPPPPSSSALYPLRSVSTSRGVTPKILHRSTPSAAALADSSCRFSVRDNSLMKRLREAALRSMPACSRPAQRRQKPAQHVKGGHPIGCQACKPPHSRGGSRQHPKQLPHLLPRPIALHPMCPQQLPDNQPSRMLPPATCTPPLPAPTCDMPSRLTITVPYCS